MKFGFSGGKNSCDALCDAIYTCFFKNILGFTEGKKMFRENCFENMVSDLLKISLIVHKTTFRKSTKTETKKLKQKTMKAFTIIGGF